MDFPQSRLVGLASPDRVRRALGLMQRPATARLTAVLGREVALREGLKAVLSGEVTREADPVLQPPVAEIRQRLAELTGERR